MSITIDLDHDLRERLACSIAARDGVEQDSRIFPNYRDRAEEAIRSWIGMAGVRPPETEDEQLCEEARLRRDRHLSDQADVARKRRLAMAERNPEPIVDPETIAMTLIDEATGRRFIVSLPKTMVRPVANI